MQEKLEEEVSLRYAKEQQGLREAMNQLHS